MLENVRTSSPLIHNITNYVTVNDCANVLLACGASPVMADEPEEAADITSACDGLVINIGTLHKSSIAAMLAAGKRANELGRPVLLDPVGVGASRLRTETAEGLLGQLRFAAVRGNISEIKALALRTGGARGVDADAADLLDEGGIGAAAELARGFSETYGAITVVTGATDIVASPEGTYIIKNGHKLMSEITGSGCMLSCLTAAFIAANPGNALAAATAAVCAMGLAGERAAARLGGGEGNATFRNYLIDEIYRMDAEVLDSGARATLWRKE
jgi:hydroxyethylthiazole kinase